MQEKKPGKEFVGMKNARQIRELGKDVLRLSWELQVEFFSSNMLLDIDLHPHISKFGMTRTFEIYQTEAKRNSFWNAVSSMVICQTCMFIIYYGPQSLQLMENFL